MRFIQSVRFCLHVFSALSVITWASTAEAGDLAKRHAIALSELIQDDGAVVLEPLGGRLFGGALKIGVGPSRHAHFWAMQKDQRVLIQSGDAFWDAQVTVNGIRCQVRTITAHNGRVYVLSQFDAPALDIQVVGMLQWEAATGHWEIIGEEPSRDQPTALPEN